MKKKLIASIVTLTVVGGAVTPTFATVKETSKENTNLITIEKNSSNNICSISGSILQGLKFKKIWWSNGSCGSIIIGGIMDKPNNGGNNNNDNNVVPPSDNTETPEDTIIPPTGDETPSVPDTPSVDETPSVPDAPSVDEMPSVPDAPSVDETPSIPDTPSIDETPSIPDTPSIDETPDNSTGNNVTSGEENFMAAVEMAIYNKVNEERAKAGVPTLTYNTVMQKYARIKSQDMGDNNYFSHEDLNGNLITTQMKKDGVSYNAWGENIAYIGGNASADSLAEQFMTNWMNSSGHRANILSTNFSSIGVGVYKIGNKVYATQEFYG